MGVEPAELSVGQRARFELAFTVGPLGIAEGGAIVLQPPPFWGWSPPQAVHPDAPGFVTLDGATFEPRSGGGLLWATATEDLEPGRVVRIVYGAGPAGAVVDRFAERGAALWVGVDGDGDGVRGLVEGPVRVDVRPGPAERVLVTLPSTAEPGDSVRLTVAVVDAVGNAFGPWAGSAAVALPSVLGGPTSVVLDETGVGSLTLTPTAAGVYTAVATWDGRPPVRSNPLVVREGIAPILWGDLQIHTAISDGTGVLDDVYRYAKDVAGLDVAVPTDHDHWGMAFLDTHPELWAEIREAAARWYAPGTFVSAPGFEWTNWIHGHRHVVYFAEDGPLLSSLDARTDTPDALWAALRGRPAVTIAHHSAGGPVAVNWAYPPDPELEPVTEIVSVHGQSESWSTPGRIHAPVRGNFVHDQLREGVRLGFLGSTDGHDGHPGLSHLAGPHGGLAAIGATARTREAVHEALRERRVYATNGVRSVLRFAVDGVPMGGTLSPREGAEAILRIAATAPVVRVELVGREGTVQVLEGDGRAALVHGFALAPLVAGDFRYVRIVQADGGMLWSSPVFVGPG